MSELDDVQTTVAVIDGLRSRIAELELVTRHSTRTLDLPGSPAPKAADLLPGVEHYDGCWQYHFDCAIERIAELEAEAERLTTWAERSEQLAVDEGSKRAKAEAHAADCKRLVTAAEDDIDALRLLNREYRQDRDKAEAEVARLRKLFGMAERGTK